MSRASTPPCFTGKARAASLLRCDACVWKPPNACRPCHAHPSTPRRARGSWEAQRAKSFTAVKTAPPARAPFWAWPNNVSRLCVAQARGLLSVYKSRGSPFDPFTCARAVRAAPAATLSRAKGGSKSTRQAKQRQDERHKEQEGEVDSPGKTLAGAASAAPARALPGQLAQRQQGCHP